MKTRIHLLVAFNHIMAAVALYFFNAHYLWLSLAGWLLFGKVGGEIGLHRYFAHRSFTTSLFWEKSFLVLGALNCFGPPLSWVGVHRKHHQHSDTELDPHGAQAFWRVWLTFWRPFKIEPKTVSDILRDPWQRFFYNYYFITIGLIFLALGAIDPLLPLYLISVPAVVTFHSAGMVNAACHWRGYRRFETPDKSYNNLLVNFLTLGSGLHNNHHADPLNHLNSHAWYEIDLPGALINHVIMKKTQAAKAPLSV